MRNRVLTTVLLAACSFDPSGHTSDASLVNDGRSDAAAIDAARSDAAPPDAASCAIVGSWLLAQTRSETNGCIIAPNCGHDGLPPCGIVGLCQASQPGGAGTLHWEDCQLQFLGDFDGAIDGNLHFATIGSVFPGTDFVGDIAPSCVLTGTMTVNSNGCFAQIQLSGTLL